MLTHGPRIQKQQTYAAHNLSGSCARHLFVNLKMENEMSKERIVSRVDKILDELNEIETDFEKVHIINQLRLAIHQRSPFRGEPVDCILWVPGESVASNDYNPNSVAPPEMELLKESILQDGYTQPIVTFSENGNREVVDGFHRNRVGKECAEVKARVRGYLPVVTINSDRADKGDRIAATIRHNRARGKHRVEAMADIVVELKRRNWSNEKIAKNLGMDADEVLRLCQITGMAEAFADSDFSKSWDIGFEGTVDDINFEDADAVA